MKSIRCGTWTRARGTPLDTAKRNDESSTFSTRADSPYSFASASTTRDSSSDVPVRIWRVTPAARARSITAARSSACFCLPWYEPRNMPSPRLTAMSGVSAAEGEGRTDELHSGLVQVLEDLEGAE